MTQVVKAISMLVFIISVSVPFSTPASAASVDDVTAACDNMAAAKAGSCSYTINKAGDINGCSEHSCFYCPNDGKRECFAVRQGGHVNTKIPPSFNTNNNMVVR
jgi:hypothetical protein